MKGLKGRGGSAQDYLRPVDSGKDDGCVASVVTGCGLSLLVVGVLLLFDNDQPQPAEREEQGAAGACDNLPAEVAYILCDGAAPGIGNMGVKFVRDARKMFLENGLQLL